MSSALRKILFFGDSLTAGYGLSSPDTESFPALIRQKILAENFPYTIINAGLSGDTSSGGLSRIDYWLSQSIDVFVLELGINDFMRGFSSSTTLNNLDMILDRVSIKFPDCKLVIMGMDVPPFLSDPRINDFKRIFKKLSVKYKAALVPFFLEGVMGISRLNLPDGLHPSKQGYVVIADKTWPVIKAQLSHT
jgi:acyl-CoA thioesterase-1